MNEGLVDFMWNEYLRQLHEMGSTVPQDVSSTQYRYMKGMFYAGALAALAVMKMSGATAEVIDNETNSVTATMEELTRLLAQPPTETKH